MIESCNKYTQDFFYFEVNSKSIIHMMIFACQFVIRKKKRILGCERFNLVKVKGIQ